MANTVVADRAAAGTTAYDLVMRRNFRSDVVFSSPKIAKVMPTNQTHRGSTVKFWFTSDLAAQTTALTENADVTPQSIGDSSVDVTITEYGAAVGYTRKVAGTDMMEVDMDVAKANANQAIDSYELLARNALMANTQVVFGNGAANQAAIDATDTLKATDIRKIVANMRNASVPTIADEKYLGIVSPFTSIDLREETGDAAWITSKNYQDDTGIKNGFIGTFGGVMFYETPRVALLADAGAAAVDVYQNVILGQEALACAYAQKVSGPTPGVEISPVTDKLNRFHSVGWYWLGGFKAFRTESSWRLETASSIGANA